MTPRYKRENVAALFHEIKHCAGKENCWGKKNPKCQRPVVLPCKQQPEIMIVTEQMNLPEKKWKKDPREIPEDWNSSENLLNIIKDNKGGKKSGIVPRINELFHGKFLKDFENNEMSFREFYWTHFIKCAGNLRSGVFELKGLDKNICADTFLSKEIRVLRPKVIVCMGEHASTWILKKAKYGAKWTDLLWEEVEQIVRNEKQIAEREIAECGHKAEIIVLPHPSGINPLATLLNKKLKNLLYFALSF